MLDIQKIRAEFPILNQKVNGKPLVYFDNGATSQKPQVVIDAISKYYQEINANIHRGVHTLSQMATDAYEVSRKKIQNHINAKHAHEIIFTSGTTHSINAVANGFASILKTGEFISAETAIDSLVLSSDRYFSLPASCVTFCTGESRYSITVRLPRLTSAETSMPAETR